MCVCVRECAEEIPLAYTVKKYIQFKETKKIVSLKSLKSYEFGEGQSDTVKCDCERPCTVWECSRLMSSCKVQAEKRYLGELFQLRSDN